MFTLDFIVTTKSFCISEWVFDKNLKNKEILREIFSVIISSITNDDIIFLWTDTNELLFYPINKDDALNYTSATFYFANEFMRL
jgi:hypothetical protein